MEGSLTTGKNASDGHVLGDETKLHFRAVRCMYMDSRDILSLTHPSDTPPFGHFKFPAHFIYNRTQIGYSISSNISEHVPADFQMKICCVDKNENWLLVTLCRLFEWSEFEHLPKVTQKVASSSMASLAQAKRSFNERRDMRDCPKGRGGV